MLTYGLHITQSNDPLQKVDTSVIIHKIKNPKPEFETRIDQLRQIRILDEKQYRRLKTQLPYFCCGLFHPMFRKKENFAAIQCFTLDFDHFSEEHIVKEEAFDKIKTDERVRFVFTSPSGDGLKALFLLEEPCTDAGLYSHFYKIFAQQFAQQHELKKVTDWVTHDVSRATFFSADRQAWDNPIAVPIKISDFITPEQSINFKKEEKQFAELARTNIPSVPSHEELNADTLAQIKYKLNPNYRPKKTKKVFVPEELTSALPRIAERLGKEQMEITDMKSINYGKQLKVQMAQYWAEINVFYGQRGFTVVKTSKTGSNDELAELAYQIIDSFLNADTDIMEKFS